MDCSSDEEFWNQVEALPRLREIKKIRITDFFEVVHTGSISIKGRRLESIINNIRLAKEVELNKKTFLVRKQTIKEIETNVEKIRFKYEEDVQEILNQNQKLKNECLMLRRKLNRYVEMAKTQEYLLTCSRVLDKDVKIIDPSPETKEENSKFFESQIKLLRDVCNLYMKDLDVAKEKTLAVESCMQSEKERFENQIEGLNKLMKEQEGRLRLETEEVRRSFERFRDEVKGEIALNEVINKKLNETNLKLKEELKNAQNILQTPRLRQRTFERFKSVGIEKVNGADGSRRGSLLSLPLIGSEKEGFSTHFDTPKHSYRQLDFNSSKKLIS